MSREITYFYSHVSPWSYMGHQRLRAIADAAGAKIHYRPVSVAGIFPKTGGIPLPKRAPERRAYRMLELKRWSAFLDIPLNPEPTHFPMDDRPAMRLALAAQETGAEIADLSFAIMRGCWVEDRNTGDWDTLRAIADDSGLEGATLVARAQSDEIAERGDAACDAAVKAGCFGLPWYDLDGEGYWGQDRLDLLEHALRS
jgi:2-hydroxychromene-2-carboxylate isomerase